MAATKTAGECGHHDGDGSADVEVVERGVQPHRLTCRCELGEVDHTGEDMSQVAAERSDRDAGRHKRDEPSRRAAARSTF
jgi:hypothetical protein